MALALTLFGYFTQQNSLSLYIWCCWMGAVLPVPVIDVTVIVSLHVQTLEQWALWVWHYYNKTQDSRWQPSPPWSGYNLYGRHFNICSNLLVKNYPHIQWKIHNSFNFWATAIKFHDFIDISFLHVFTRNEVSCGNHYFEKYAAKSTLWKFCCVKVMGKYSLRVYCESFTV